MPHTRTARDAILDAAEGRFAARGFASTTVKQVAGDAGVNSALLYYYFADKEALYAAVVARLITRLSQDMMQSIAGAAAPDDALRAFIARQGEVLEANPHLTKVLGREMIDHDAAHAQSPIRQLAATTFARLEATIRAGQKAGLFRRDLDPRFAAISIVSQTVYFHFARPAIEILLGGRAPLPAGTTAAWARHVTDFSLSALGAHSTPARGRAPAHRSRRAGRRTSR